MTAATPTGPTEPTGLRYRAAVTVPGLEYPLPKDALRRVAVQEGPLLAWLMDEVANWSCDDEDAPDCHNLVCDHAAEWADNHLEFALILQTLSLLSAMLLPHRSTGRILDALAADGQATDQQAACEKCHVAWPCPAIRDAEEAAAPLWPLLRNSPFAARAHTGSAWSDL